MAERTGTGPDGRGKPCVCGHLKGEHRYTVSHEDGRQVGVHRECVVDQRRIGHEPCSCPGYVEPDRRPAEGTPERALLEIAESHPFAASILERELAHLRALPAARGE